ncbi:hypothetical protein BG006_002306 [Podila minutissima]|uniref:Uncharacterized protein n=1 Tax=Podila minutissima TaxID=64525 RepID=A0A9P5SSH8_9FUNG|nr:hypothetical protein BG006_002306 [Podila minutissima]
MESIHVDTVKICSGGMPLPKAPRSSRSGAFLRLKHLTHSYVRLCPKLSEQQDQEQGQGQTQDVESPEIFPWIFAPHLETLTPIDSLQGSAPTFSISLMVEDLQLAREAAAAGRNYYLDRNGEEQQDHQQQRPSSNFHYGLIPFCKLRAVAIHSHRFSDGDIAFLINTIEALQRITLQFPGPALQTFCALGWHKHPLTEVVTRSWDVDSAQVLTLLTSCEKLEALAATEIRAQDCIA